MFEIDIKENAREGIMLHKQDGTPYWKLLLTCHREGCEKEVDMGECLCFDRKDAMVVCRDTHGMTCSTKCWYEAAPKDQIEKVLKEIKRHNDECMATGEDDLALVADDEIELIDDYFEATNDYYDGSDFWEMYDLEECPI